MGIGIREVYFSEKLADKLGSQNQEQAKLVRCAPKAIRLKPKQIESDPSRMVIRVEQGKGRKERYTGLRI